MTTRSTLEPAMQTAAQIAPAIVTPNPTTLLAAAPATLAFVRKIFPATIAMVRRHPFQTLFAVAGLILFAARSSERRSRRQRQGS